MHENVNDIYLTVCNVEYDFVNALCLHLYELCPLLEFYKLPSRIQESTQIFVQNPLQSLFCLSKTVKRTNKLIILYKFETLLSLCL